MLFSSVAYLLPQSACGCASGIRGEQKSENGVGEAKRQKRGVVGTLVRLDTATMYRTRLKPYLYVLLCVL